MRAELLREFRTTLITDVVAGQNDFEAWGRRDEKGTLAMPRVGYLLRCGRGRIIVERARP